jgi:hypothetical protein
MARGNDDGSRDQVVEIDQRVLQACAEALRSEAGSGAAHQILREATRRRSEFMWPWECEPQSLARGILDDETYDWRAVVGGMISTGGWPVVVTEAQIAEANRLGCETTGIDVDYTGSAGLAGVLALAEAGRAHGARVLDPAEQVAVIFSGARRTRKTWNPPL